MRGKRIRLRFFLLLLWNYTTPVTVSLIYAEIKLPIRKSHDLMKCVIFDTIICLFSVDEFYFSPKTKKSKKEKMPD